MVEKKERTNKKTRTVGNGEGSLYKSEKLNCLVFQYHEPNGKRKTIKQKKGEANKEFKARVTEIKSTLDSGTYISKSQDTVITLLTKHIDNKYTDKITSPRSYRRDLETLKQIESTCSNFCYLPIQKVTIEHIEKAKVNIRKYANSSIDKIWAKLIKAFSIASSPSRKIIPYNIMLDEELKKPISDKKTKKVKPLDKKEFELLFNILNNEQKMHPYSDIVKMQMISGMRIGEVLSRSKFDFDRQNNTFHIHNTLTQDEHYNVVLGEHTKTYNKLSGIDEGERYIPLNNDLFKELSCIIEKQFLNKITNIYNLLFWDYENNTFITPSEIDSWLKRINKKYHITEYENLTSHRLRHSAITHWAEIGLPMQVIQYLAGHVEGSNITSSVYIDISYDYVQNALNTFKSIEITK